MLRFFLAMRSIVQKYFRPGLLVALSLCACSDRTSATAPSAHQARLRRDGTAPHAAVAWPALDVEATRNATRVQVRPGQTLRVHLRTSPALGGSWSLVDPLPPPLRIDNDPGGIRGAGGDWQSWTFRAEHAGRARLSFVHALPWQPESRSVESASLEVLVR